MLATAESCTGGLLAGTMTARPGASAVFDRGFITYSNEAKAEMLGVSTETLEEFGAVSAPVARAMATGALKHSHAGLAVSVTGIAGPGGGSPEKPVGLVFIGHAFKNGEAGSIEYRFQGSREDIRGAAIRTALSRLIELLEKA